MTSHLRIWLQARRWTGVPEPHLDDLSHPTCGTCPSGGRYTLTNVRRYLPRIRSAPLRELLGAPTLEPTDLPIDQIMDAAMSASCLITLQGNRPDIVATRRAIAKTVRGRLSPDDLAALLGVSRRTAFRFLRSSPDHQLERAIRLQLGLRKWLRERKSKSETEVKDGAPIR